MGNESVESFGTSERGTFEERNRQALEVIEPDNKFRVDSSPTEVVIRIQPVGALTRKDALLLAAHLAAHANRVDDGSTNADIQDAMLAVMHDTRMPVSRDQRDLAELRELRVKCADLMQELGELRTPAIPGNAEETPEERRLRRELQASLNREAGYELRIRELLEGSGSPLPTDLEAAFRAHEATKLQLKIEEERAIAMTAGVETLKAELEAKKQELREVELGRDA
jgi:hypothetical protein